MSVFVLEWIKNNILFALIQEGKVSEKVNSESLLFIYAKSLVLELTRTLKKKFGLFYI